MPHSAPPQIALHIGAHKTATTHFQRSVLARRPKLASAGIQYFGPPQLRGENPSLLRRFDLQGARVKNGDPAAALAQMLQGGHRLAISEENFIGSLLHRSGRVERPFYPKAAPRVSELAARIAPQGIDVCLSLRQPSHFLNSTYGQHLLSGGTLPPDRFLLKNPMLVVDWVDLVARLRAAPGVRALYVWRYEDYWPLFDQIATAFLGQVGARMVRPLNGIIHRGLSMYAAADILDGHAQGRSGAFWNDARAAFPVGPDVPSFDAFGVEGHAVAAEAYADQVAQIAAIPGVSLLWPDRVT